MLAVEPVEFDVAICGAKADDKRQALRLVAGGLAQVSALPAATVLAALESRESFGSTGIGRGVALPHARLEGAPRCCRVVMRLDRPVDFDAIDDRPVDLVVGVLSHPNDAAVPRLLSRICRLLRDPRASACARGCASEEELRAALSHTTSASQPKPLTTLSY